MQTETPTPEVGMGATISFWSDREAATIIEVSPSGHRLVLQADTATRIDSNGMSDAQAYTFERNPNGRTFIATRKKNGRYQLRGGGARVTLGHRSAFHDYSF